MIVFTRHAREKILDRGVSASEVEEVLREGRATRARLPRLARAKVFTEGYDYHGRRYAQKMVKGVYAQEGADLVVVTVYCFYGKWQEMT